jgi:hypothetical protein
MPYAPSTSNLQVLQTYPQEDPWAGAVQVASNPFSHTKSHNHPQLLPILCTHISTAQHLLHEARLAARRGLRIQCVLLIWSPFIERWKARAVSVNDGGCASTGKNICHMPYTVEPIGNGIRWSQSPSSCVALPLNLLRRTRRFRIRYTLVITGASSQFF